MTTAPFDPRPEHVALTSLIGSWSGSTKTWFDPTTAPEESPTQATIESLLGGRSIRIDYQGTAMGKPHAGQMIVGYHKDAREHEVSSIDSFHTGSAMMMSVGTPRADGEIRVLGSYAAGPERWGWRTVIHLQGDELVIEATNISPTGQEDDALETRLRRTLTRTYE